MNAINDLGAVKSATDFLKKHAIKIFCFACFAAVLYSLFKYLQPLNEPLLGHDAAYHYLRVEAMKYNIQHGNLFTGVDYLFLNGAGYASSAAYPDLLLFIPALLRIMGVSVGTSMSIFLLLCSALTYLSMFLCGKKITGSPVCGTIAAVIFCVSQYRLENIFTRFALGEIQAFIFWPLILYGLYDLIFDEFKKPYVLGLGFAGMVLSHTISTAIALGVSVIFVLIFIRRIIKTPRKLLTLLITAVAVLALTTFYWLPLLELLGSCDMTVSHPSMTASSMQVEFHNLFRDMYTIYAEAGMGIAIFLLCLPRVLLTRKSPVYQTLPAGVTPKKRPNALIAADACMVIGLLLALATTDKAPWKILAPLLDFMQFPWRLFAIATALLTVAGAVYVFYLIKFTKSQNIGMVVITIAALLCAFIHLHTYTPGHAGVYEDDHYSQAEATFDIGMGEWLPMTTKNNLDAARAQFDKLILSNGAEIPFERNDGTLEFSVQDHSDVSYAVVPYVWYKGYTATDENGTELSTSMSDIGLLQVDLQDAANEIVVTYHPTTARVASNIISAAALFGLLILLIWSKLLYFKKQKEAN